MRVMKIVLATMTGISISLLPFAASPLMGQYLSVDGTAPIPEVSVPKPEGDPTPFPICDCPSNPVSQSFSKDYADTYSAACASTSSTDKYRNGTVNHIKYICRNGVYWSCLAIESNFCKPKASRPSCPQDTCGPSAVVTPGP